MPVLKIDRILSFSSEDKVHVANNLLGNSTTLKWKSATAGEKQVTVCFQLNKPSMITGIDIGNEHSAYIEVLVSRSEMNGDYKSFLLMSSFMSAIESRQSTNMNRVRMFKKTDFSKPECDEKWDRIKIVCTQPFNRHVQYGLSFIKFHSSEGEEKDAEKKLGRFNLRPESPVDLKNGSLFARRKEFESEKDKPTTAASAIRAATSSLLNDSSNSPVRSPKLLPNCLRNSTPKLKTKDATISECTPKPRNRNDLFYTEDEEKPNDKIDKLIEQKNVEKLKRMEENKNTPTLKNKTKTENKETVRKDKEKKEKFDTPSSSQPGTSRSEKEPSKRKLQEVPDKTPKKMKITKKTKPFEKLLDDVVLVISGIQNPDRTTLRGKVLEMGAKYKPDWDSTCTHLVCAFMNTPKFNQVKGKGKIVTRQWVEECYSQRKKIPWRRYALDRQEKDKDESEDEIFEKIEERSNSPTVENGGQNLGYEDIIEQASDTEDLIEQLKKEKASKIKQKDSPIKKHSKTPPTIPSTSKENSDNIAQISNKSPDVEIVQAYSAETDTEEETKERKLQVKNKPFDFFKTKKFFIDSNFEDYIDEMLRNYIFIHEGSLFDDPREDVDYIICGKDEAKDLSASNTGAICVLPDWIVDCHKCRQFIPPDEYFVL